MQRDAVRPIEQDYDFDCCSVPEVWLFDDVTVECRNCSEDWTDEVVDDD